MSVNSNKGGFVGELFQRANSAPPEAIWRRFGIRHLTSSIMGSALSTLHHAFFGVFFCSLFPITLMLRLLLGLGCVFAQRLDKISLQNEMHAIHPSASSGSFSAPHLQDDENVDDYDVKPQLPEFRVIQPSELFGSTHPPLPEEIGTTEEITLYTTERPANAYEINFCDKTEFPDDVLATYGLQRQDYFIWNVTCSHIFFQCSIGHTFQLSCTSEDQAYDSATSNCNFKNAVKICPEYDHVMHCTVRESCSDLEFACCALPQQCLPIERRCDGHADCADGDDENNCPSCARDEFACVKSGACISAEKRCDGVPDDCGDGSNTDEIGCSKNSTCIGKFMCSESKVGSVCVDWKQHCDGNKDCYMGEDELNCKQQEKYLLCENQKQSVRKMQWCDGTKDCADGSDEKYCH